MTSRRRFLVQVATAVVGAALDPEKLVWQPGKKTIFLPSAKDVQRFVGVDFGSEQARAVIAQFRKGDIVQIEGFHALNPLDGRPTMMLQQFVVTEDAVYSTYSTVKLEGLYPRPARNFMPRKMRHMGSQANRWHHVRRG